MPSDVSEAKQAEVLESIPEIPVSPAQLILEGESLISKISALYADDYSILASEFWTQLDDALHVALRVPEITEEQSEALRQLRQQLREERFSHLREVPQEMKFVLNAINDVDSWNKVSVTEGISSYYQENAETGTHSFQVAGEVRAPLFNVVAVINEIGLFKEWLPSVTTADKVASIGGKRVSMLAQLTFKIPWPMAPREVMLYGYGDTFGDSVAVFFRSAKDSELFPNSGLENDKAPPPPEGHVRADLHFGGFLLTPIDENRTMVRCVFNFDPKFPILPYWLLNVVSEKFCYFLLKFLRKTASPEAFKSPECLHSKCIQENRRVYGEIERRLEVWKAKNGLKQQAVEPESQ